MTGRFITAPPLQVVGKVAIPDENSLPDCRVTHTSAREGRLAETLPAALMHHEALQELQLQLVPFQVKLLSALHIKHASVCCRVRSRSRRPIQFLEKQARLFLYQSVFVCDAHDLLQLLFETYLFMVNCHSAASGPRQE